jgi:hypothetical protein
MCPESDAMRWSDGYDLSVASPAASDRSLLV